MTAISRFLTSKSAILLLLPLLAVGVVARDVAARIAPAQTVPEFIESPPNWIAFKANVKVSKPGEAPVVGRFYRSSDGSTRLETGATLADVRVISINNVQDRMIYEMSLNQWRRRPSPGLANAGTPMRWRKGVEWQAYAHKLAIRAGESGSLTASEGFDAFAVVNNQGVMRLRVPALNMFDAVLQRPDGRYEAYSEIEIGESPAELFMPPTGVSVVDRPTGRAAPLHK